MKATAPSALELVYLPLKAKQTLPLAAPTPSAPPAAAAGGTPRRMPDDEDDE